MTGGHPKQRSDKHVIYDIELKFALKSGCKWQVATPKSDRSTGFTVQHLLHTTP